MRKTFSDISEVFDLLNEKSEYLVLRNYENMDRTDFLMDGHDDIDILCNDRKSVIKSLGARKTHINTDHYFIRVNSINVKLGIRYLNDYYYDIPWEIDMLRKRKYHSLGFYVMDDENYFYSLLYHALLQKKHLSDDYKVRLRDMAQELGITLICEEDYYKCLIDYLNKQGYSVTYPKDCTVPNQFSKIPKEIVKGYWRWRWTRVFTYPYRTVRRVYVRILKERGKI